MIKTKKFLSYRIRSRALEFVLIKSKKQPRAGKPVFDMYLDYRVPPETASGGGLTILEGLALLPGSPKPLKQAKELIRQATKSAYDILALFNESMGSALTVPTPAITLMR